MGGKVGDLIVVESETVGQPIREGEILEVIEGEVGLRYRVRWTDGHETVFTPSGGAARIVPSDAHDGKKAGKAKTAAKAKPAGKAKTAAKSKPAAKATAKR